MPRLKRNSRRRPWIVDIPKFSGNMADFYNSAKWRKLSKLIAAKNPLCAECRRNGITAASHVTDHIIPIIHGGDHYDERNLERLCHSCHNAKSAKEKNKPIYSSQTNGNGKLIPTRTYTT